MKAIELMRKVEEGGIPSPDETQFLVDTARQRDNRSEQLAARAALTTLSERLRPDTNGPGRRAGEYPIEDCVRWAFYLPQDLLDQLDRAAEILRGSRKSRRIVGIELLSSAISNVFTTIEQARGGAPVELRRVSKPRPNGGQ